MKADSASLLVSCVYICICISILICICIFLSHLLYISRSGFQMYFGGRRMSTMSSYSDLFHAKFMSSHSWNNSLTYLSIYLLYYVYLDSFWDVTSMSYSDLINVKSKLSHNLRDLQRNTRWLNQKSSHVSPSLYGWHWSVGLVSLRSQKVMAVNFGPFGNVLSSL